MQRSVSWFILGPIAPVVLMLAGWWGTLALAGDSPLIPWLSLAGIALGVALDLTVLRSWAGSVFELSNRSLSLVAVFYSVMIYGFFMGFPVPLLMVSVGWGCVAARGAGEHAAREVRFAARGSALIVLLLCCVTAALAFNEPTIARQTQMMLGLPFTPSIPFLSIASVLGGIGLVVLAHRLAWMSAEWASRGGSLRPSR